MNSNNAQKIEELVKILYGRENIEVANGFRLFLADWKSKAGNRNEGKRLDQTDVILITYGDSIKEENVKPLETLYKFLTQYVEDAITGVHILPAFPHTSDDGFSVTDYYKINSELGSWDDIRRLSRSFNLMLDAVVNHVSRSSEWFEGYLECQGRYKNYFITADPTANYSQVIRPRTLPLLTPFETKEGTKYVWTTFSEDQIDLNYANPEVLLEILNVLLTYAWNGARFLRLDAIGFIWKELGTTCMHLKQTHTVVKLMRAVLDEIFPGTFIITETNVPHADNISYFGNSDEAHLVYQFPLPPLTMFSLQSGDTTKLTKWAQSLENTPLHQNNTYFNFLASHDGVGVRPLEGILGDEEKKLLFDNVIQNGGRISYAVSKDGSVNPYELNISYMDGITHPSKDKDERVNRFMAAQAIMLSMQGVPGIYYHSLLGSESWYEGADSSGINRRINREKLDYEKLTGDLKDRSSLRYGVFTAYKEILKIRAKHSAFSPYASQKVLNLSPSFFAVERYNESTQERIIAIINVTDKQVKLDQAIKGTDLFAANQTGGIITKLEPYQIAWILV